jgi:hypothetical protein
MRTTVASPLNYAQFSAPHSGTAVPANMTYTSQYSNFNKMPYKHLAASTQPRKFGLAEQT